MSEKKDFIQFFPSLFHSDIKGDKSFIERYLKIFETILSHDNDNSIDKKALSEVLDIITNLFHPRLSFLYSKEDYSTYLQGKGDHDSFLIPFKPVENENEYKKYKSLFETYFNVDIEDFLQWMAKWIALTIKEDWDIDKKREIISKIIPIYRMRGTKKGLEEFLSIYVRGDVTINVGESTKAYHFDATINIYTQKLSDLPRLEKSVKKLLDLEKPAHTTYGELIIHVINAIEVGVRSTVDMNTFVG